MPLALEYEYSLRYKRIKEEHGRNLVKNWTEKTDPKKFVYEDCGIATYLLEYWGMRDCFPKKFADLGCGNGLLVHLLNKEGVNGIGIDVRKRKIWSQLLSDTSLIEASVDPSEVAYLNKLVSNCVWLNDCEKL
ncbi:hypothetical protein NECAME_02562 [Necator americanus]|uniref:tRNA (uracil-O(2)-)-methyltransferase n=1 Tax=Necator americanus TaxID=51031 RepID=W2TDR8_NECAM|nr:hypothetical protein NECAME_02562 [Necator americanus]ETN79739.1 hypothetical protein NECAME_02562 [Necator americanus]